MPQPDQRRLFFRYLARETVVWFEELLGKPNMQLSDLPKLPPEAIAALISRVCPGGAIIPEEGQVSARIPGASESVVLFPNGEENLLVFNRFNGEHTIGEVAGELGAVLAWPRERSFAHVKDLFFQLVRLRVCLPANISPPQAGVN